MKRQIRRGCFETNSSSTHAICIAKAGVDKESLPKSCKLLLMVNLDGRMMNIQVCGLKLLIYIKQFVVAMKKMRSKKS